MIFSLQSLESFLYTSNGAPRFVRCYRAPDKLTVCLTHEGEHSCIVFKGTETMTIPLTVPPDMSAGLLPPIGAKCLLGERISFDELPKLVRQAVSTAYDALWS